ncbi:MAG: protein kinase, partial [Vicinamibacterales bacterium]
MNTDRWNRLAEWHNAWLDADAAGRRELRSHLGATEPDLIALADDLVADDSALRDFLETPAFLLAARRMAEDTPSLSPGADVGPYRVIELIAHGGMGVVYRATDIRLHRDVALKMLAPIDLPDEPRVERFLREARLTASIDHPNVVKVYDVGVYQGRPFIVAELLHGETLRARLNRGSVAPALAGAIATHIARGLVAAHSAGLVHRDLKPENIFLTRAGVTKVLDFGIAKLARDEPQPRSAPATLTGMVFGTPAYLAPEQIRGDAVDARTDLFALGSILVELVTGTPAFTAGNTVDTLHAVMHAPAHDLIRQRDDVPAALGTIAARLLQKAPADRFQSAADVAWALEQADTSPAIAARPGQPRQATRSAMARRAPWLVVAVAASAIALAIWGTNRPPAIVASPGALTRFTWTLPQGTTLLSAPVVSPDGQRICWAGMNASAGARLFVRDLSSLDATPIPGSEGARHPFWSPDGRSIGFFARGRLQRIAVEGGPPVVLAEAADARGGTWSPSGVIVFAPLFRDSPLMRVPDVGGAVQPVTILDREHGDITNRWPVFLPDGIHFVYSVLSMRDERGGIYVGSVNEAPARSNQRLFASDSGALYASLDEGRPGALLSVGNGRVELRPFDPARRVLTGDARTLGINTIATSPHDAALLTASSGVLAYSETMLPWGSRFAAIGRDGSDLQFWTDRELGGFPRISPDGSRLARTIVDTSRGNPDIWLDDLRRGTQLRLTTSGEFDVMPTWSSDGREIAYRSGALNDPTISFAAADGTGVTRTIACPQRSCEPSDWSPD